MCLTLNDRFHSSEKTPIIADKDYVTYKILVTANGIVYFTPYRSQKITFDELNIARLGKVRFSYLTEHTDSHNITDVFRGYHTFLTLDTANEKFPKVRRIVPAIIPEGTKFFIGKHGDIVSNNIIYVKDEETLKKYYPDATYLAKVYKKFSRKNRKKRKK